MIRGLWTLGLVVLLAAAPATARQISADLSSHEIEITAGFDGAELLLFGHAGDTEADVIVIVSGPDAPVSIRRKERVAGIWINQTQVGFPTAPVFYFVGVTDGLATTDELDKILEETGLGARYLGLSASDPALSADTVTEFRDALVELRSRKQLYATKPGRIEMRPDGLFRADVPFPAATPVGAYTVTVYEVIDGWPVAVDATPLTVRKGGFGAFVYAFANREPALYGIVAILIAATAGWLGGWAFRRG